MGTSCLWGVLFLAHFEWVLCCSNVNNLYSLWIWKGSVRSVAFFMLDKVPAPELIAATVESSILPYAEDHEIPFDELLLQYIKVKLHHCQAYWVQTFNFPNACWKVFLLTIWSSLGPAGALQFSDHNTLHRMGSQSSGCARLHDGYWRKFL